jgi:hypothetical protein
VDGKLEKRYYDEHMEAISKELIAMKMLLMQLHQRQNEFTIPKLTNIELRLFGNGKKGLLEEHAICQQKLNHLDGLRGWVKSMAVALAVAIISFAVGYGKLIISVDLILTRLGMK